MTGKETNKLVKGALFLTLAGIIGKILSAGYRIPLQNLTGDLGFYMYQQIYPLLGMILILSLYGFPSAISKMVVELRAERKGPSFQSFYLPIFLILFVMASLVSVVIFLNAERIAIFTGDARLTKTYKWATLVFLLVPFTVLLRGVFQGHLLMKPIAISQVGEQLVRVSMIILGAYLFFINKISIDQIGEMAVFASLLGAFTVIIMLSFYFRKSELVSQERYDIPWRYYIRTLCLFGVVSSMNHMVLLIIQFADVFTLVPHLVDYGLSETKAMAAKGVLDRGQPLIQLGTVLGSSFALTLIPTITTTNLRKNQSDMKDNLQSAMLYSFYLAAGAVIGLVLIFPETNALLFQDTQGTRSLQIIACAILLSSLAITSAAILQGIGSFKRTAFYILGAFVIKWFANGVLVPLWGIAGGAISTVLSLLLLTVALLCELKRQLPDVKLFRKINGLAFIIASVGMSVFIIIMKFALPFTEIGSRSLLLYYVLGIVLMGGFIYFILLLRFRAFNEKELHVLPLQRLWMRLYKRRDDK